jgi:endo-1,4-beta-xylanase
MIRIYTIILIIAIGCKYSSAQNTPIIIEAEAGTLGIDYETLSNDGVTYITAKTNFISASNPATADKTASYSITFSSAGTYKLYLRVQVGPASADDDSFFYGNGFGVKDPAVDNDWITCNQLGAAGFIAPADVVEGQGNVGNSVWKWVAFSDFTGSEGPVTFDVSADELVRTFQIGAREDGFGIDKIAFGRMGVYFTVENLNNGEAGSTTPPVKEPAGIPLAEGHDKFLGCSYSSSSRTDFEGYWNQVTSENGGKWGSVEGSRDNMSWRDLDEAYKTAMDYDFVYKHHVLVWGSQQPGWMAALDSAEQRDELEEWFAAVAERYPGLDQIEVVNEPLHAPPDAAHEGGYIGALGGSGETGWDWILEAFRIARDVFSDTTELLINEYGILNGATNTDTYLKIIKLLQEEDLIDGIGFQAHGFSQSGSNDLFLRNIDTLASTGLPIYVTEMDIDGLTDLQHVHGYMKLFPLLWEHPAIKGITLWGFTPAMWRGDQGAYLIDDYGVERPAMLWLRAYLNDTFVPNESIQITNPSADTSIVLADGQIQFAAEISPDTSTLQQLYWDVSNSTTASIDQNGIFTPLKTGTVRVRARSLELNSDVVGEIEVEITDNTSVTELNVSNENFRVYPNPSNDGKFTVEGIEGMSLFTIYDLNGKVIKEYSLADQSSLEVKLDVPEGVYMIKLFDGKKIYDVKISIQ